MHLNDIHGWQPEELIDLLFEITTRPEERLVLAFHEHLAASVGTARTLWLASARGVAAEVFTTPTSRRGGAHGVE